MASKASNASDIAKAVGLETHEVINVFDTILAMTRRGERVTISGFGSFNRHIHKGRTQVTPLVAEGEVTYPDKYILKYKPSDTAKERFSVRKPPGAKASKKKSSRKK